MWHNVEDLAPHPEDPSKQLAKLTYEDEFGQLADPEPVEVVAGEIQEGREYKKILVGAGAAALAVTIATGTLIIRHKRKR